jgi:tetratricopeptide (TPR) repeat protein
MNGEPQGARTACARCGGPLAAGRCAACDVKAESGVVRREFFVIVILGLVLVFGFVLTRAVSRANDELRRRDAAEWFTAGEQDLAAGRAASAVIALRHAVAIDRDNGHYRLALGRALVTARQDGAARQVLVGIRELAPEDPEVNLQLARLEARQGEMPAAIRYFQSALHGTWGADQQDLRRRARVELVRYLLAHDERARALSELLILDGNLPDEVPRHLEAGELFLGAGDAGRALEHFRSALGHESGNRQALAGAGEAAFEVGDYAAARRFLLAARPDPGDARAGRLNELREVADLVLDRDPLRPRLPVRDRRARLTAGVTQARTRLDACVGHSPAPSATRQAALDALRAELDALHATPAGKGRDGSVEAIEAGLNLIYRIERETAECGPPSSLDRALLLIAKRHEIDQP